MNSMQHGPRNTAKVAPEMHFLGMLDGGATQYITDMEAQGQRELLASTTLPTELLYATQEDFEALGFVFGDAVPGDALFRAVTLPSGWTREGSDHAMWSYLLDERGVRRVGVFYKAAFYDRAAHMNIQNVGHSASTEVLYGEEPVALPEKWAVFTEAERESFIDSLHGMADKIAEHPTIYGKYADRLAAALALAGA